MIKPLSLITVAALACALPCAAQTPSSFSKPLSESELLRTIDSLGTGDPTTKAPLSVDDNAPAETTKTDKNPGEKKDSKDSQGPTEITAREAFFDQKVHQAVFGGDVVVKSPDFNVTCEKLTAFLHNDSVKPTQPNPPAQGGKATPAPVKATPKPTPKPPATPAATSAAPNAEKKGPNTGGLEKAIAEGSVVITQDKLDAEGNVTHNVGKSRRAVYDSITGDVTLTGRPEVQQGINTCIALDDSTVIVLNREGRMTVKGPHKTVIKDAPDNTPGSSNSSSSKPTAANVR